MDFYESVALEQEQKDISKHEHVTTSCCCVNDDMLEFKGQGTVADSLPFMTNISSQQDAEQIAGVKVQRWHRRRLIVPLYSTSWFFILLLFCLLTPHCIILSTNAEARTQRDIRFKWKTGSWKDCESTSCGAGGIQLRTVNCVYADRDWRVPHSSCEEEIKPTDKRSCFKVCEEHRNLYKWNVGPWQECRLVDSAPVTHDSEDKCKLGFVQIGEQHRNITCGSVEDESVLMENYVCAKFSSSPFDSRSCDVPCPINCVTSHWNEWSKCSKSCGNGTQYRTRSVLTKAEYGGSDCPQLSSTRSCPDLPVCLTDPLLETFFVKTHVLKFGNWSKCVASKIQLPISNGSRRKNKKESRRRLAQVQKSLIGKRERHVTCLDDEGESLGDSVTMHETCTVTKNCETTQWTEWSFCFAICGRNGNQTRTREIMTLPTGPAAQQCPQLEESRECQVDQNHIKNCKQYTWVTGGWTECGTVDNATCGGGVQQRDVYCVVKDEFTIYQATTAVALGGKVGLKEWAKMQPVDDDKCEKKYKPAIWQECDRPCEVKCEVGTWSDWSECAPENCDSSLLAPGSLISSRKSAKTGFKRRVRAVLEDSDGIDGCPHTNEVIPCDNARCFRLHLVSVSRCVPLSGSCGKGTQEQTTVCKDMWGKVVSEDTCKRAPAATVTDSSLSCHVPCGSDCVVTEWSTWTPCTHVCKRGRRESGNQTRFREILANPGPGGKACPPQNQLNEGRLCNQHRCSIYYWDVGKWSDCQVKDSITPTVSANGIRTSDMFMSDDGNSTGGQHKPLSFPSVDTAPICGTGYQDRTVKCRKKDSGAVQNKLCGSQRTMPLITRDCTFPCPRDCVVSEWGDWSSCEAECEKVAQPGQGSPGPVFQKRHRVVVQHRTGRGTPCPIELNQRRQCIESEKCMLYRWHVSKWSECVLISKAKSIFGDDDLNLDVTCIGAMTRKLQCRQFSSSGESLNVDYRLCMKYADRSPPEGAKHCFAKCERDSNFADWQQKMGCLATVKQFDEIAEDFYVQSRNGKKQQSYVTMQKTAKPVGEWSSCNITKPNEPNRASLLGKESTKPYCGTGVRRRALACYVEGTDIIVDNSYCHYRDFQEEMCEIPCPVDCKMSAWASWGRCGDSKVGRRGSENSELRTRNESDVPPPCGENLRMRYQFVNSEPLHGGRPCPIVDSFGLKYEMEPCQTVCDTLFWVPYSWRKCEVNNNGAFSNCGTGLQSRDVKCFKSDRGTGYPNVANVVTDHRICDLDTMPYGSRSCSSPCPGECVFSEWSSWQKCEPTMGPNVLNSCDGIRKRTKTLLRKADVTAVVQEDIMLPDSLCSNTEVIEEREPCELNRNCYTYSAMWTEWSGCLLPPSATCGSGRRERRSNCVSVTGLPVHEDKCISNSVPLPPPERQPCRVACSIDCEVSKWTSWSRCTSSCDSDFVRKRTRKVIREPSAIGRPCPVTLETTPCPPKQCHTWKLAGWSKCKIAGGNCGTGVQFREVECLQHDGVTVSDILCENHQGDLDNWFGDSQLRRDCQIACAGECHMTEWSTWGECHLRCLDTETHIAGVTGGLQTRSRVGFIVGQINEGDCPPQDIQERSCGLDEAECYIYQWKSGTFYKGKRPVWCERTIDKKNVSSGCQEQLKPQEELYCIQHCDDIPFSYCTNHGVCDCDVGYHAASQSSGTLDSCVEDQPNDEAEKVQIVEIPKIDQRSVIQGKNDIDEDKPPVATETEIPSTYTTGSVTLKKSAGFFEDLNFFTDNGNLKVWVYGAIAGIVVFIIFMIAVIYLICTSCCKKKPTTMYGQYSSRTSSSSRRKRRHNSSGSNVGVGMVIGMGTPRFPPSNSAMSHTSSTSRSGFSYPDQYGGELLWKET